MIILVNKNYKIMNSYNNSDYNNYFQINTEKKENINSKKEHNILNDENSNDQRINYKLSLRKQKIKEKINNKRDFKLMTNLHTPDLNDLKNLIWTDKDLSSGALYDYLENAYKNKNENDLLNMINGLGIFINKKISENLNFLDLLINTDSSYNLKNNIKSGSFPLGFLLLKIGLNTNDKMIYSYCFNYLLYFTYELDDFLNEIINKQILNDVFEKLIHFHPFLIQNQKDDEKYYTIFKTNIDAKHEIVASYWAGSQILSFLGNLFVSSEIFEPFEEINFYEKIFYLFLVFNLNYEHKNFLKNRLNYLDSLIWIINLIIQEVENISINYNDKILNIIPCILNYIKILEMEHIDTLEKMIELIENIGDINDNYIQKIVESDGLSIMTDKICYLFNNKQDSTDKDGNDTIDDLIDKLLYTIINVFSLDSKYLKHLEYSNMKAIFSNLIFYYKDKDSINNDIANKLVVLLGNLACFEDIEQIVQYFLLDKSIINTLFKYYYNYHKNEILLFIDNVMTKQNMQIRDLILDMGGFDIIKNNICSYNDNENEVIKSCINILYKLIMGEKDNKNKVYFDKFYKTSVPDKIKELYNNKKIETDFEKKIKFIIEFCDNYEKSLDNEN